MQTAIIICLIVFILSVVFGVIVPKVIQSNVTKVKDQPKVVFKTLEVETYGHDIDILKRVKENLPERPARLQGTYWDISVDIAGQELKNEWGTLTVGHNDSILTVKFTQAGSVDPISSISWNLTRFEDEYSHKIVTFKTAFTSDNKSDRNAAKECQNILIRDLKEWAAKCQDEYEYNHCPPEPVVEIV
ncbi:hypothetical protein SEA_NICEHOUSE_228 [Rhodococcus phage NiceHouse]|nr:hypothetical protein SEA_NICEHOUSE_228 [Rhodococcus phage NiceHouse]